MLTRALIGRAGRSLALSTLCVVILANIALFAWMADAFLTKTLGFYVAMCLQLMPRRFIGVVVTLNAMCLALFIAINCRPDLATHEPRTWVPVAVAFVTGRCLEFILRSKLESILAPPPDPRPPRFAIQLRGWLDDLPVDAYKATADGTRFPCSICLSPFVDGEPLRTLPCFHSFHQSCIDEWIALAPAATCPLCRIPIFVAFTV
ncbi:RING-type domain-containing protein [Plasmodiophora brassicae]|uniref:RING-type domain-containing protein n=1 Tax=Plasmodiophora brassicae TaxID=37360 RepID=A0A0G4J335_PLABS|nr:hypothetical protein PBRA_002255 [Plasmodiophora brassicae]SPQ98848.1 unnamed protein product [Plasmodiophora brassicae]